MVNFNKLMKQAQEMQERIAQEMAAMQVEASAGGGAVTVSMNGKKEVQKVAIRKEAVDLEDLEILEDLVRAAFNEAARRVDEQMADQLGGLMPPGFTPPF